MDKGAVGILDSGFGGLSIWQEIKKQLPKENLIYFADSVNFPYGNKTKIEIRDRVVKIIEFLKQKDCKLVVIACNTATTSGIDCYRERFPGLPIVGVVPVIKTAAELTKKRRVGILATPSTINTDYYQNLIKTFGEGLDVYSQGVVELAELVERGDIDSEKAQGILKENLKSLKEKGIDCLCLGCTHFSFLRKSIEKIVGSDVTVLDSSGAVARQVGRVLVQENLLANGQDEPEHQFFTTGDKDRFKETAQKLLWGVNWEVKNVRF